MLFFKRKRVKDDTDFSIVDFILDDLAARSLIDSECPETKEEGGIFSEFKCSSKFFLANEQRSTLQPTKFLFPALSQDSDESTIVDNLEKDTSKIFAGY